MSSIRILSDEVANRIAAGEVIERPASVVKELIENAVDAGATRIRVQLGDGGGRLIQVTDNGFGMDRDDALLCIEPHATSKIHSSEDIERIQTLGFRGEALPSIASVSHFQLQTRASDSIAGTEVVVEGGELRDVRECGCPPGTTVRVARLFYNMPARRKFLRRKTTEESHVYETVLVHALGNPTLSFELHADGRRLLAAVSNSEGEGRAAMLLGRETAANLLPCRYQEAGVSISGYIARPGLTRATRREQRFFVNGRPAASGVLYSALRDTYASLVAKGRYPPVLLGVEVLPEQVDVNVHPGKKEVRFRNPRQVGDILSAAVRRCLKESASVSVAVPRQSMLPRREEEAETPSVSSAAAAAAAPPAVSPSLPWPERQRGDVPPGSASAVEPHSPPPSAACEHEDADGESVQGDNPVLSLRVLGCLADTYVVAEGENGLVLIDQRAAHERILYERLLGNLEAGRQQRQPLLMPVTVELSPRECRTAEECLETFEQLGFSFERFGGNTVLIRAVPARLPDKDLADFLRDTLAQLEETGTARTRPGLQEVARAASRTAVPSRHCLSDDETRRLLADLARTQMPYTCPSGRPVMVNLPLSDIARRFGRGSASPAEQ